MTGAPLKPLATAERSVTLVVPGDLATATGGYEYDRRMLAGLQRLGWTTRVMTLAESFPMPTLAALHDADRQLAAVPDGHLVVIDGLALGAMPEVAHAHAHRLRLVGLVHHPLAAETGLTPTLAAQLFASERRALSAVRRIVVTSSRTRHALAAYGVAADAIEVVEPGVDLPLTRQAEERREDPATPVRLLCVATLTPRKGHALLIEALSTLTHLPWTLTCVGDMTRSDATTRALKLQIEAARLEDRVVLTGEVSEAALHAHFCQAEVFVLATRFEGYGMAVAQALAHELPIISTRTGAIEVLVPSDAGVLVEPGDVTALRDALSRVLSDPILRRRLASGARAARSRLASWRVASERFSDILIGVAS